jgi:hypothetical protein
VSALISRGKERSGCASKWTMEIWSNGRRRLRMAYEHCQKVLKALHVDIIDTWKKLMKVSSSSSS